ncbi:CRISPR-associated Cst1 family protein [Lysinibacillus fusiformis ZB2]|uniref:Cas8a1 family CRISPR/Cas system-associated protein n=1 Tax=Lysinibacillus capsici TaxID=2115968 RepID=UPI00029C8FCA|nr:Cas8a1 family CRISPR/Cas system-associated protein [Lysinibacillus capsici]EKU43637.1 CRISPR-associated Cst1 family protein [Lysinibacillus fusiformis ZB2]
MIELQLDETIYNASILGLCRVFDYAKLEYSKSDYQTISFPESNLANFEEHYFAYLSAQYGHETNYYKMTNPTIVEFLLRAKTDIGDEKNLERLNAHIEKVKYWLSSNSYKNVYPFLSAIPFDFLEAAKSLKKVTQRKKETLEKIQPQIGDAVDALLQIVEHLKHKDAKRFIIPRVLTYQVIQGFWSNVSFLNSNASKKDLYEEYFNYFIKPAQDFLTSKKDEKKYGKNKLTCACCDNKMKSISEAFDLTWVQNLGVDGARKSSHYWNHQRNLFICPICNIVYSCLPLGFTLKNGIGLFINSNQSIVELLAYNKIQLRNDRGEEYTRDKLEEMAYSKIINEMYQHAENKKNVEIDNIQIVKYDKNNESRPYTFNMLSRDKAQQLYDNRNDFHYLTGKFVKENGDYISLYQEVIRRFYNGQRFSDLLYRLIRLVIDDKYTDTFSIYKILKISNYVLSGGSHYMTDKELRSIRISGYELRKVYRGQETKLNAISHRLLNALKVKNPNKFMETIVQAYSYKRHEKLGIPLFFTTTLSDIEKFQTIGYAFLIGLNGKDFKKEDMAKEEQVNE